MRKRQQVHILIIVIIKPKKLKVIDMKLGYTEYMDCAHFLPGHPKCGQLHGHTYKVEVVIEGENKTGMILDFGDMKKVIREVLAEYDHKSLNDFLAYPSVENICDLLKGRFCERWDYPFTIRVWEGNGKWAETEFKS